MKSKSNPFLRIALLATAVTATAAIAHAADVTLTTGTYTDTQSYTNGTLGPGNANVVTFNSGANYSFSGNLTLPMAWNRITLNSGASLNVAGNLSVDVSGVSLNGGTLTTGGLLLHDSPDGWTGTYNDGKQTIQSGDSIINGATVVANQSNANFISMAGGTGAANGWVANNLWLGNDGATINSNGYNIGITMALGNFSGQTGSLTKIGAGTLTLTANNSYAGNTVVNGGVLDVAGSSGGNSYIRGTVTVNSGAELRYTGGDGTGFGFNGGNKLDTININGGLVDSQNNAHLWSSTLNMTGGTLQSNGGISTTTGSRFEWNKTTLNTFASPNTATIAGRINIRGDGGYAGIVFNVADGAAATDLLVSAAVTEAAGGLGITKTGAGTMALTGTNSYTGATTVSEGTLKLTNASLHDSSSVVIASGAILELAFTGSDIIGSLSIAGSEPLPPGTYNFSDPTYGSYFKGPGSLLIGAAGPQVSGTWVSSTDGNWSDSANWQFGNIANGVDQSATFNPGAVVTATVDGNRFIGSLDFTGFNTALAGTHLLTLQRSSGTPVVNVAPGLTATLATDLGGTQGFEKTGPGTLKFTGAKSYTGETIVTGGTLDLSGATGGNSQISGVLTISSGASVTFTNGDGTGFGWTKLVSNLQVNGGTMNAVSGSHLGFGGNAAVTVSNGGTLAGAWNWNGGAAVTFSSSGDTTNTISGNIILRGDTGNAHAFTVQDGTADTDLLVDANLTDRFATNPGAFAWERCSFGKDGDGTLVLAGTNSFSGNTYVAYGTLKLQSGARLTFYPEANDTSNKVTGIGGSVILDGTFYLNLRSANLTNGNAWTLLDVNAFATPVTFGSNFSVTSSLSTNSGAFTQTTPGTWQLVDGANTWTFSQTTGVLTLAVATNDYATWGTPYGLAPGSESGDLDHDGLTNFQEYAFGLIPNSGSSVNPVTIPLDKATGHFSYTRRDPAKTGIGYKVFTSTTLESGSWTEDSAATASQTVTGTSGDVQTVQATVSSSLLSNPKLFIQVRAH